MVGWFKPRQKSDEVGDIAQSVYQDLPEVVEEFFCACGNKTMFGCLCDMCSAEKRCLTCGGSLFSVPGESNLCLSCFKRVSKMSVVVLRKG